MTTSTLAASRPIPSFTKLAIILGTLSAFAPLSIDMYLPALPSIAADFNTQTSVVQQTLAVFFIGLAVGQAFYGPIADRVGRRTPLLFGSALYMLACIGCAFAPTIQSLILLRLAQALGGCAGIVISRSIVRDLFDMQGSARMYSFLMLVMGLAPITAPLIGGQLLLYFGWRAIFITLSGFGLLCFLLVTFVLPETLPVERRNRAGLGEALRAYGEILASRSYMGYAIASGLASSAMFAYISGSPFVFIELNGVAPERFGLLFGTNAIGLVGAAQLNRWLLLRFSGLQILKVALTFTALSGLLLLLVTATGFGGFPAILVVLFFCIASTGLVGPNATAAAMAPYAKRAGSAAALLGATQFVLGAGAGSLVGLLHNGTAIPMAFVIALCTVGAYLSLQFLAIRSAPTPTTS
jgi:DHA1 family bicyclomycin/chloramphenicol resistance-like MFS transporter